jgi:formylglycine-generating enzyme required for sulfatase activity
MQEEYRPRPHPAVRSALTKPRWPVNWEKVGAIAQVIALVGLPIAVIGVPIALGAWLVPNAADILLPLPFKTPTVSPTSSLTYTPVISTATLVPPTDTPPSTAADMVHVPAGEFIMGSPQGEGSDDEHPQHTVYLDAFYIDKYEVTNAQFAQFLNEQGNQEEDGVTWLDIEDPDCRITERGGQYQPKSGYSDHPVNEVSWYGARAYCEWAGKRLPTEAEWEKAARGTDGRTYPWGNAFDGSRVNFCDRNCEYDWKDTGADDGYARTAPVGSYPAGASPHRALDMAGNVCQWVADWYDTGYYANSPESNPRGPASGDYRVIRGSSWYDDAAYVRAAYRYRDYPDATDHSVGFRCAR